MADFGGEQQQLDDFLKNWYFQSKEEKQTRQINIELILQFLRQKTLQWHKKNGFSEGNMQLCHFGSAKLGLFPKQKGDLDIILISGTLGRDQFFSEFNGSFLIGDENSNVVGNGGGSSFQLKVSTNIQSVTDARIPLLRFSITITSSSSSPSSSSSLNSFDVDLLFAKFPEQIIPTDWRKWNVGKAKSMDDSSLQSILGVLDNEFILEIMSTTQTWKTLFLDCVAFIRIWAKERMLYGSRLGYLHGFSWAVMVAYVMVANKDSIQQPPHQNPLYFILSKFFETFANWDWKKKFVSLPEIVGRGSSFGSYTIDPRTDVVCVLTCSMPIKNSTRNVSKSQVHRLQTELARGNDLFKANNNQQLTQQLLSNVAQHFDFFERFPKSLLKITVSGVTDVDFKKAFGWTEAKLITLVFKLEKIGPVNVLPWPASFDNTKYSQNYPFTRFYVIGIEKYDKNFEGNIDLSGAVHEFTNQFSSSDAKTLGNDIQIKNLKTSVVQSEILSELKIQK